MTANVLVVCTGNICRSPMAEAMFTAGAGAAGLDAQVTSAGSWDQGVPAEPHAVSAMAARGIDLRGHRSHTMTRDDIEAADLIVAMAREHVIDVAARVPAAFEKTFTLKELAARASGVGPKNGDTDLSQYLVSIGVGRSRNDMLRNDQDLDIDDPLGQGRRAFERTAAEIEALVWAVVDLLAGFPPRS